MILLATEKNADSITAELIDDSNKRIFYLAILDDAINNLHYKATHGRIRDEKKEKLKIDMYRALFYGVNVANSVYKDKQIDDLAADFLINMYKGLPLSYAYKVMFQEIMKKRVPILFHCSAGKDRTGFEVCSQREKEVG